MTLSADVALLEAAFAEAQADNQRLVAELNAAKARIAELEASPEPSNLTRSFREAVGVRRGSRSGVAEHEKMIGRPVETVLTYAFEPGQVLANDQLDKAWLASRRTVLTIGLVPKTLNDPLAAGSPVHVENVRRGNAGEFDGWARQFGVNLKQLGICDRVIIRLGHEHNLLHTEWHSTGIEADWVRLWRRVRGLILEGAGTAMPFEWNCGAASYNVAEVAATYPGDDVVDVVGVDFYDRSSWDRIGPNVHSFIDFAASHHKPFGVSEWGLHAKTSPPAATDDNPTFITNVLNLAKQVAASPSGLAYLVYFDMVPPAGTVHALSAFPKSLAVYKQTVA